MASPIRSCSETSIEISPDLSQVRHVRPQTDQLMQPANDQTTWLERKMAGLSTWIWHLFRGFSCRCDIYAIEECEPSVFRTRAERIRIIKSNLDLLYVWEPEFPEEYDFEELIEEEENPYCGILSYGELWDIEQETWDCIIKLLSNAFKRLVDEVYLHPEWEIDRIEEFADCQIEFLDPLIEKCQYSLQMEVVISRIEETIAAIGSLNNGSDVNPPREPSTVEQTQEQRNIFVRTWFWMLRLFSGEEPPRSSQPLLISVPRSDEESQEPLSGFTRRLLDWEPAFPEYLDRNALISIAGHPHEGKSFGQAWELKRDDWNLIIKLFVIELNRMQNAFLEDDLEAISFNYLLELMHSLKDDLQYPLVKRKLLDSAERMVQLFEESHIHP